MFLNRDNHNYLISCISQYLYVHTYIQVLNKSGNPEQLDQFAFLNPDTKSANSVIAAKRGSERNCVKLRGLPWEATAEEVIEFFGDMNKYIEQHGVHMVLNAQVRVYFYFFSSIFFIFMTLKKGSH